MIINAFNTKSHSSLAFCSKSINRKNFAQQKNIQTSDLFIRNSQNKISFTAAPKKLFPYKSPEKNLSAKEAIEIYEKLRNGAYLDHGGDLSNVAYKTIRKSNLEFLECITQKEEKEKFVEYFCNLTGFPNLENVSQKIEDEFVKASEEASHSLFQYSKNEGRSEYEILALGYDGVCSVADNTALPGSDIDKAYIILRGTGDLKEDVKVVQNFKRELWERTDQRILSYNHDLFSFPKVYTKTQVRSLIFFMNKLCRKSSIGISDGISRSNDRLNKLSPIFIERSPGLKGFKSVKPELFIGALNKDYLMSAIEDTNYLLMRKIPQKYQEDYAKANKFLIEMLLTVPKKGKWNNPPTSDNTFYREDLYDFAFILETMLFGKQFKIKNKNDEYWNVMSYFRPDVRLSDCLNTSQIRALKNGSHTKQKRKLRKEMAQEFEDFSTNKQFEIIKEIIKGSANMNENPKYENYFSSNEPKRTVLLCRALELPETK